MAFFDCHIALQAALYFCIMVAGFIAVISVGINRQNFDGSCILYGELDGFLVHYGNDSLCTFPIYFGVIGWIIYGLSGGCYYARAVYMSRTDHEIGSRMWVIPFIIVNSVLGFITLVAGCIISVGFLQFCNSIKLEGTDCSVYENKEWHQIFSEKKYNTGPYVTLMTLAQIATWTCVLFFILQVGLHILRFYRNRNKAMSSDKTKRKEFLNDCA